MFYFCHVTDESNYFHVDLRHSVIPVLINDTGFALDELVDRVDRPPLNANAILVVLPAVIIEAVRDFMADHHPNG